MPTVTAPRRRFLPKEATTPERRLRVQRRAAGDDKQLGIGVSVYVEITGGVPPMGEAAKIAVQDDGSALVYTGTSPHGQGHDTAWSMIARFALVPDVAAVLARAAAAASATTASATTASFAAPVDHGVRRTIFGEARIATLTSPAGLRIDLVQR